jgi:hypothetical protein
LFRKLLLPTGQLTAQGAQKMQIKNLGACEDKIMSILALNELGSEQRNKLNRVCKKLSRARRQNRISREEVFEIVREVAEALIESSEVEE